jgi:hypothetical protein
LLFLHETEALVKAENLEKAKIVSTQFLQKIGTNALVEGNLKEYIQPSLEAAVWKDLNWDNIANEIKNVWIVKPNIITLHNWKVGTYFYFQKISIN